MPGVPTNRELRSCPWTAGCMIAALAFPAGDALAISRYNSASMTCSAIHDTLNRERAVILRYSTPSSGGAPLYDRYVVDGAQCWSGTEAARSLIPAGDGGCSVLYCKGSLGSNWNQDQDQNQ
jgi:hypothetical protein